MGDLVKQHQEVCGRLAAAAAAEAGMQQQLARLTADKQALQQQIDKVSWGFRTPRQDASIVCPGMYCGCAHSCKAMWQLRCVPVCASNAAKAYRKQLHSSHFQSATSCGQMRLSA